MIKNEFGIPTRPTSATIQKWLIRILLKMDVEHELIVDTKVTNSGIMHAIGLSSLVDVESNKTENQMRLALRKREKIIEAMPEELPSRLEVNLKSLSTLLNLNTLEQQVLAFVLLTKEYSPLSIATDYLGEIECEEIPRVLAPILDVTAIDLFKVLSKQNTLFNTGILVMSAYTGMTWKFRRHISFLMEEFVVAMFSDQPMGKDIFKPLFSLEVPKTSLTFEHFPHIKNLLKILLERLQVALNKNLKGVNILIYGPPGTGKTEIVPMIASNLGCRLRSISSVNSSGDPLPGIKRLRAYTVAQTVSSGNSLIMFDEIEDVPSMGGSGDRESEILKAWTNKLLEENSTPAFWVCNDVMMDDAFKRRFDLVIDTTIETKMDRKIVFKNLVQEKLSEDLINRISGLKTLTPAVVERSLEVALSCAQNRDTDSMEKHFVDIMNGTLKVQGHDILKKKIEMDGLPLFYSTDFLNTRDDVARMPERLVGHDGRVNILLSGPSGTGKSVYAKYLAEKLGRKMVQKKPSDLLSMYVGGTEARIAEAFEEVSKETVLLIDEVDTVLLSRDSSRKSWENSQVNELLLQLESHNGIFLATTNLYDSLDRAVLRRFDKKIKLGYLRPDQSCNLFIKLVDDLGLSEPSQEIICEVSKLSKLTPGDFGLLKRQSRFDPFFSVGEIVTELQIIESEKSLSNRIGFI